MNEAIGLIDEGLKRGWRAFTATATEGEPDYGHGLAVPAMRFRVKFLCKGKEFVTVPLERSRWKVARLDQVEVRLAAVSLAPSNSHKLTRFPILPQAMQWRPGQPLHISAGYFPDALAIVSCIDRQLLGRPRQ